MTEEIPFYNLGVTVFKRGAQMERYPIQHGEAKLEEDP